MNEKKEIEYHRDERGRPWARTFYYGSEMDVMIRMPSLMEKIRRIIQILDEGGDRKEAKELGYKIWNETQMLWYGLHHISVYDSNAQVRSQFYHLAETIEEFQQDILISMLGIYEVPHDLGIAFLAKMTEDFFRKYGGES